MKKNYVVIKMLWNKFSTNIKQMHAKKNVCFFFFVCLFSFFSVSDTFGQTAQVINETGGTGLTDGLKIQVNLNGYLSVYRDNQAQYYSGHTWPSGNTGGVRLEFRFSQGSTYNANVRTMTACSTTPVQKVGNTYTTSITGYVLSPISNKNFYVTLDVTYTHPTNYFYVDYHVRAPSDLGTAETVHLYLAHDAYILGKDGSRGYRVVNTTGEFVGDYRNSSDTNSTCNGSSKNPRFPSTHGFKTKNGFRSYYSAAHGGQYTVNSLLSLSNTINTTSCPDDGVSVEFTLGPLSAGQTLAKQVMHGYGNAQGEFDNTPVNDPTVSPIPSTPVTVQFTSIAYSEAEGNTDHTTNTVKLRVSGGTLHQAQVCNITVSGGNAIQNTDYTYVKGFTIPAGNYTTPQEFTLNNITIKGNTTCQNDRTFNIVIDTPGACNDLIIKSGTNNTAVFTIEDDEPRPTITTTLPNLQYYHGQSVPVVALAATPAGATIAWTNSNTSIGLAAGGTSNVPTFTANNNTNAPITATITVTPTLSCTGTPKTYTITVLPRFTITYHYNGGVAPTTANPTTYTYGTATNITNEPTRSGYTFSGWTCPELSITTPTKPFNIPATATTNVNLYADWGAGPNSYTITYNLDGGTVTSPQNPTTYDVTTPSFSLKNPTKPGFTFAGWTGTGLGGNTMTVTIPIGSTGARSYTANWNVNTYTISYGFNGGTAPATANKASYQITEVPFTINTTAAANQPTRTGYTFAGWTGQGISSPNQTINVTTSSFSTPGQPENLSYTAQWTPINYTITYNLNGGTGSNPTSYNIQTPTFSLTNPTRPGYTFAGWTGTGLGGNTMSVSVAIGSTNNRSYTANWTAINYTLTYVDDNGSTPITAPGAPTQYNDTELPKSFTSTPVKPGWTFTGWTGTGAAGNAVTIPTGTLGNQTYQANWTANAYTITFNPNSGVSPVIPAIWAGYDMTDLPLNGINVAPTRTGYTFNGWTGHGQTNQTAPFNITSSTTGVPGNLTYTAQWSLDTYNLTYNLNGGSATNPATYNVNSTAITLNNPTRTGYTFTGWTGTDIVGASMSVTIPTGSIGHRSYTATWSTDAYTITYTLNGGSASNPAAYDVTTPTFSLNNPTRSGYTFAGWTGTGLGAQTMSVSIPIGSTGNRTYTANWTAINYTLTYVDDNGSTPIAAPGAPTQFNDTELPKSFTSTPVKSGWTFVGWTGTGASGAAVTIPTGTHMNLTYQAVWTANAYSITFNANGGTNPSIPVAWAGYDMTDLPINTISVTPTRTGYTFNGWTGHGQTNQTAPFNITSSTTGVPGNLTYTAQWNLNTYNLTYNLNGGTATNPATYNVTTPTFSLNNPTRTGYTFAGWTGTDLLSPTIAVSITTGSVGNRSYTATWVADGYAITYNLDGGTVGSPNPATYTILTPAFTLNNPTRPGYTFAGWTGTGLGAQTMSVSVPTGSTGVRAYTATWTPITYTITYNLNSGTATNPTTYDITTPNFALNAPTRAGYTFTGWTGSNGASPQTTVTVSQGTMGNLNYEAHWSADAYSITFNPAGGVNPTIPSAWTGYDMTDLPINGIDPAPTRLGYTFKGWTGHGLPGTTAPFNITNTMPGVPGNLTFVADWQLDSYTITYHPNGGIIVPGNPVAYDVTMLPTNIATEPTHLNPKNVFIGWTCQQFPSDPMALIYTIPANTTGNLDMDAHWTQNLNTLNPSGVNDTLFVCEGPRTIYGDPQGKSWQWILPNGTQASSRNINVSLSGQYICNTNYGTKVVADTLHVYFLMANSSASINYITITGAKIDKPQQFVLDIPAAMLPHVTASWTATGGTILNATTDSLTAIWSSPGEKKISVQLTFNYGGVICSKTIAIALQITERSLGFFVDENVSGGNRSGRSWEDAHLTLQDALRIATVGDQIWVARGTYRPISGSSFEILQDSIEIYGGFDGTEQYLYERNPEKNKTILSGNNTHSVVVVKNSFDIRIDGFTIENGQANKGAGIHLESGSSGTIANCIIKQNSSSLQGGGIHASAPWYGYPALLIVNTEISGNQAIEGAGIYNNGDDMHLLNTTISGNRAEQAGGFYTNTGSPIVQNTIIWGNQATKNTSTNDVFNNGGNPTYAYSIIGGSQNGGAWNSSIGIDGSRNKDVSPLFRRIGFEDNGTMRSGDYRIAAASAATDAGSNAFINAIQTPWDILLSHPKRSTIQGLVMDLDYMERIHNDRVDIGAYETGSKTIAVNEIIREVILPKVKGLITDPEAGPHRVKSHQDFVFTIRAEVGYSLDFLTVTTGVPIRDKEGIRMKKNPDGSVTVTILQVWEPLTVSINNVSPLSNRTVDGPQLWAHNKNLHVKAPYRSMMQIFALDGKIYLQQEIEGETVIPLAQGFYTIVIDGNVYKVMIN